MMRGRVIKYGDNVDTDVIIPARYLTSNDREHLARHCMEGLDPDFLKKRKPGDIIVGGNNFGCGSSREDAPVAIQASGMACVIARPLPASSTAMPSTSAFPFWNRKRPSMGCGKATRWKWTRPTDGSTISAARKPIVPRLFRR